MAKRLKGEPGTIRRDLYNETLRVHKWIKKREEDFAERKIRRTSQEAKNSLWRLATIKNKWVERGKDV